MFSRVGPLVRSLGEQVLSGMGLHVVAFAGGESSFRKDVREARYDEFLRLDVLGTDGRPGETIAQILEQLFDLKDYVTKEDLTSYLTDQGVDVPDHQADLILASVERTGERGMEVVEVAVQGVVRQSRERPIMLTIDNTGLSHLDLKLLLSLARFPHVPVLIAFHLCGPYDEALTSVQRLTRVLGHRVVSLSEPREVLVSSQDWPALFENSGVPHLREVTLIAALLGRIPKPEVLAATAVRLGMSVAPAQAFLRSLGVLTSSVNWQFSSFDEVLLLRSFMVGRADLLTIAEAAVEETSEFANASRATASEVLLYADLCVFAEVPSRALGPLRRCALGFHLGEPDVMARLVSRHSDLLEIIGTDYDRLAQEYVSLRIAMTLNEPEVESRGRQLLDDAEYYKFPDIAANALRVLAIVAWNASHLSPAREMMEEAAISHAEVGDWAHAGQDRLMLGWWSDRSQDYAGAHEAYGEAIRCFEVIQDEGRVAEAQALVAISLVAEQKFEEATLVLDQAWIKARRVSSSALCADILNSRSEIARAQADWETAHEFASQAHAWFQLLGHRFAPVAQFNLGLIALGAHRFGDARAILEEIRSIYPKAGLESRLPLVDAALAVCALAWRDATEFDERLFSAETAISVGFRHPDFPWVLQQGLLLAERTDQSLARARLIELIELFSQPV